MVSVRVEAITTNTNHGSISAVFGVYPGYAPICEAVSTTKAELRDIVICISFIA